MISCHWLPALQIKNSLSDEEYEQYLFDIFSKDFVDHLPHYNELPVLIDRTIGSNGRERTFNHIITVGKIESERKLDPKRCERIRWVRAFIEHQCDPIYCPTNCDGVYIWQEKRRVHIFLQKERFIVIIDRGNNVCHLITAFYVNRQNQIEKYVKRYQRYSR